MDGRTDMNSPCILKDFIPFGAAALLPFDFNKHQIKQGKGIDDHIWCMAILGVPSRLIADIWTTSCTDFYAIEFEGLRPRSSILCFHFLCRKKNLRFQAANLGPWPSNLGLGVIMGLGVQLLASGYQLWASMGQPGAI